MVAAEGLRPETRTDFPALDKPSGLAHWQGAWWSHNDRGGAWLYRAETPSFRGALRVAVPGVSSVDWEEITPIGDDLLVCDFGDPRGVRDDLTLYRVAWDVEKTALTLAARYPFSYPDGQHDAEAAAVIDGKLHIFTRARDGAATRVYRFDELLDGEANTPKHIGNLEIDSRNAITAAAFDAAAGKLVLLSTTRIYVCDKPLGKPLHALPTYVDRGKAMALHEGALWFGNASGEWFKVDKFLSEPPTSLMPPAVKLQLSVSEAEFELDGSGENWREGSTELKLANQREGEYLRWRICGPWLMLAGRFEYDSFSSSSERGNRMGSGMIMMFSKEGTDHLTGDEVHLWLGDNGVSGVDVWKLNPEGLSIKPLPGLREAGEVRAGKWTFEYAVPLTAIFGEGKLPDTARFNAFGFNLHGRDEPRLTGDSFLAISHPCIWAEVTIK
jgi:hypothetical protein